MRGDSVTAEFDSIPARDTTSKPKAKRIVANGNASSFYQLAGAGTGKTTVVSKIADSLGSDQVVVLDQIMNEDRTAPLPEVFASWRKDWPGTWKLVAGSSW